MTNAQTWTSIQTVVVQSVQTSTQTSVQTVTSYQTSTQTLAPPPGVATYNVNLTVMENGYSSSSGWHLGQSVCWPNPAVNVSNVWFPGCWSFPYNGYVQIPWRTNGSVSWDVYYWPSSLGNNFTAWIMGPAYHLYNQPATVPTPKGAVPVTNGTLYIPVIPGYYYYILMTNEDTHLVTLYYSISYTYFIAPVVQPINFDAYNFTTLNSLSIKVSNTGTSPAAVITAVYFDGILCAASGSSCTLQNPPPYSISRGSTQLITLSFSSPQARSPIPHEVELVLSSWGGYSYSVFAGSSCDYESGTCHG
jgi:hypothetical protein